jgi:hypothetical protein
MTLPNFTADWSLKSEYRKNHSSHNFSFLPDYKEHIIPAAPYWGDFRREDCVGGGRRKYSSILWGSSDWEGDCERTPAFITNGWQKGYLLYRIL